MTDFNTLNFVDDKIFIEVELNRPQVRNAMSVEMVDELLLVLRRVEESPTCRALFLRGGGGHFCAGGDIQDMARARGEMSDDAELGRKAFADLNRKFGSLIEAWSNCKVFTMTIVEGTALGGGLGLAIASDSTWSHENSKLGMPEVTLGVIPAQILPFMVKKVGRSRAASLSLTGRRLSGRESFDLGLVDRIFRCDEELVAGIEEIKTRLRLAAPGALRKTKELLLKIETLPLSDVLDQAAQDFATAVTGPEGLEGTMAFIEKRQPRWSEV
ncbi:MAG: enoyl-CoA hydratase-related protein [Myxococcota bacterium]|nr:enoyl-CoA hydratase-related protein [Myxococcota bacterium]